MSENLIEAKSLTKIFGEGDSAVTAVNHMDFRFASGELVVILGQSGAGKTTLLNLLGGMESATSGDLLYGEDNVAHFTKKQLTEYRRKKVGFVFQFFNLMPNLTAKENVEIATELTPESLEPETVLRQVGLGDRFDYFPAQLSGGEQQRVSIARAIAKNADLILCDEPTGALDYATGKEILTLLSQQAKEAGKTVVIVTHNSALSAMADHVLRIRNGEIISDEYSKNPTPISEIEW